MTTNLGDNYTVATVSYLYRCSACGLTEAMTFQVHRREDVPFPSRPGGWTRVGLDFFCPNHTLLFTVDGVAQEIHCDY